MSNDPTSLPLMAILAVVAWTILAAYIFRNPEHPKD